MSLTLFAGIEMLNYHNIGTIYMKGYIPSAKKMSSVSVQGLPQPGMGSIPHVFAAAPTPHHVTTISQGSNTTNIEINSKTYNASSSSALMPTQKNGFTEELNRKNGAAGSSENLSDDDLLIVRLFKVHDRCYRYLHTKY